MSKPKSKSKATDRQGWILLRAIETAYLNGWTPGTTTTNSPYVLPPVEQEAYVDQRETRLTIATIESLQYKGLVQWNGESRIAYLTEEGIEAGIAAFRRHMGISPEEAMERRQKAREKELRKEEEALEAIANPFAGITITVEEHGTKKRRDLAEHIMSWRGHPITLNSKQLEQIGSQIINVKRK